MYETKYASQLHVSFKLGLFFAVIATLLLAAPSQSQAKTVQLTGSMRTTLAFSERYIAHVSRGLSTLTVNVPVASTMIGYGWQQTLPNVSVHSSLPPSSSTDTVDAYGNHFRVLVYNNPPAGDIVITTDLKDVSISADLAGTVPSVEFPITDVPADMTPYLRPTASAQSDDPVIKAAAASIVDGAKDEGTAAQRLAAWMFQNLTYASGNYISTTDAKWTLAHKTGQCAGWANLMVALARASGIPARVAIGYTLGGSLTYPISRDSLDSVTVTSMNMPHSWVELWYPKAGWIPYEPQSSSAFLDSHHICFRTSPSSDSPKPLAEWSFVAGTDPSVSYDASSDVTNMADRCNVSYVGQDSSTDDHILLARCLP